MWETEFSRKFKFIAYVLVKGKFLHLPNCASTSLDSPYYTLPADHHIKITTANNNHKKKDPTAT